MTMTMVVIHGDYNDGGDAGEGDGEAGEDGGDDSGTMRITWMMMTTMTLSKTTTMMTMTMYLYRIIRCHRRRVDYLQPRILIICHSPIHSIFTYTLFFL